MGPFFVFPVLSGLCYSPGVCNGVDWRCLTHANSNTIANTNTNSAYMQHQDVKLFLVFNFKKSNSDPKYLVKNNQ